MSSSHSVNTLLFTLSLKGNQGQCLELEEPMAIINLRIKIEYFKTVIEGMNHANGSH